MIEVYTQCSVALSLAITCILVLKPLSTLPILFEIQKCGWKFMTSTSHQQACSPYLCMQSVLTFFITTATLFLQLYQENIVFSFYIFYKRYGYYCMQCHTSLIHYMYLWCYTCMCVITLHVTDRCGILPLVTVCTL